MMTKVVSWAIAINCAIEIIRSLTFHRCETLSDDDMEEEEIEEESEEEEETPEPAHKGKKNKGHGGKGIKGGAEGNPAECQQQ